MKRSLYLAIAVMLGTAVPALAAQDVGKTLQKAESIQDQGERAQYLTDQAQKALKDDRYQDALQLSQPLEQVDPQSAEEIRRQAQDRMSGADGREAGIYTKEMQDIRNQTDEDISRIREEANQKIEKIQQEARSNAQEAQTRFEQDLQKVQEKLASQTQELDPQDQNEIENLRQNAQEEIAELQRETEQEIEQIHIDMQQEIAEVRKENLEETRAKKEELNKKAEEMAQKAQDRPDEIQQEASNRAQDVKKNAQSEIQDVRQNAKEEISELEREQRYGLANINKEIIGRINENKIANSELRPVTAILGSSVVNQQGDQLGEIEDVVLGSENNQIEYIILSHGGFMGIGDKVFAISWNELSPGQEEDQYVLNVDGEVFEYNEGIENVSWLEDSSKVTFQF